jgi:ferredoxin
MAYVIIETCTKDNECIEACPVNCIHPTPEEDGYADVPQLYIHPEECIDCGACIPVCPTESIFVLEEVPEQYKDAIARNRAYFGL